MTYTYNELKELKNRNKLLSWKDVTEDQLKYLYVEEDLLESQIAELFDVKQSQVNYKRTKYNIKFRDKVIKGFLENIPDSLNEQAKDRILNDFDIDKFAKMITHFAFRNGPVEDIHANNQLSQEDMMVLNKYMVDRIAGLLKLIQDNQWLKIEAILEMYKLFGTHWDKAEPDIGEVDNILKLWMKKG